MESQYRGILCIDREQYLSIKKEGYKYLNVLKS